MSRVSINIWQIIGIAVAIVASILGGVAISIINISFYFAL